MMALNWLPKQVDPIHALLKGIPDNLIQNMMERKKQAQAEKHWKDEMELRKKQFARSGANSDLQRQLLQEQILHAKHANDPNYEFNQFQALQDKIMGGNQGGQQAPQEPQPTQPMGEGMGMFSPEGMQEAQQPPPMQQQTQAPGQGGLNLEALKQNPMLRGFFKHKFGYDPLSMPQTPEEKQASAIDLFKKKEAIKAESGGTVPAAVKTLHENIIQLSPKAINAIQHIIDIPSPFEPWGAGAIKSGQKAAHNKAVTAAAENYAKAQGWPNTVGSLKKAESILQRGPWETDFDYHERLKGYQNELEEGRKISNDFLHPGKQLEKSDNNVIEYERVNGKLVPKKR